MGMEVRTQDNRLGSAVNGGEIVPDDRELIRIAREWIRKALTLVLETDGDESGYNELLERLKSIEVEDHSVEGPFIMTMEALSQVVSSINESHHGDLLSYVLGLSFWGFSLDAVDALLEFVVNLAASNGIFVDRCLDMLVRNFLPPSCGLPLFLDSITRRLVLSNQPDKLLMKKKEHLSRKECILNRVHLGIQQIAQLVPTAALRLQPIILRRMPHRFTPLEWNALYIENMLRVESSSVGEIIGSRILMAVVDRLIEIDVEIKWEDIGHDDLSKVYVFDMEMEDEFDNFEMPVKENLDEVAEKMDILMEITLKHIQLCYEDGRILQVYETLMHSFQSTILNTHKSKFTQFLIFFLCSLAPETCGTQFASRLCDIFMNRSRPPNMRMTAAAYLASYISRAKYLPLFVVSASLGRLVEWCLFYTEDKKAMNPKMHRVFYSACQAIMYILCFRMKALNDVPEQRRLIEQLPVRHLLGSSPNPLKVCLPSVVQEFLRQARFFHLFECSDVSDSKDVLESDESRLFGGVERLDMFFPFDPYLLKRSDRFIRPNFTFWTMVQIPIDEDEYEYTTDGLEDGDADMDVSDDENSGHEDVVEYISDKEFEDAQGDDEDMNEFEYSMNRMSITPKQTMPARFLPKMSNF